MRQQTQNGGALFKNYDTVSSRFKGKTYSPKQLKEEKGVNFEPEFKEPQLEQMKDYNVSFRSAKSNKDFMRLKFKFDDSQRDLKADFLNGNCLYNKSLMNLQKTASFNQKTNNNLKVEQPPQFQVSAFYQRSDNKVATESDAESSKSSSLSRVSEEDDLTESKPSLPSYKRYPLLDQNKTLFPPKNGLLQHQMYMTREQASQRSIVSNVNTVMSLMMKDSILKRNQIANPVQIQKEISQNNLLKPTVTDTKLVVAAKPSKSVPVQKSMRQDQTNNQKKDELEQVQLLKKRPRTRQKNSNTNCPHKNQPHYAKGMCNQCYHTRGRNTALATDCDHKDKQIYAKGMCQKCYFAKYNRNKRQRKKNQ